MSMSSDSFTYFNFSSVTLLYLKNLVSNIFLPFAFKSNKWSGNPLFNLSQYSSIVFVEKCLKYASSKVYGSNGDSILQEIPLPLQQYNCPFGVCGVAFQIKLLFNPPLIIVLIWSFSGNLYATHLSYGIGVVNLSSNGLSSYLIMSLSP